MYINIKIQIYMYMYLYTCIFMCVYIYIHIYIYNHLFLGALEGCADRRNLLVYIYIYIYFINIITCSLELWREARSADNSSRVLASCVLSLVASVDLMLSAAVCSATRVASTWTTKKWSVIGALCACAPKWFDFEFRINKSTKLLVETRSGTWARRTYP